MGIGNLHEHIKIGLTKIITEVRLDSPNNLLSSSVHAESFYREFLNLLMDWSLVNANTARQNEKGIDLLYPGGDIVVQVSSSYTKKKLQDSLEKAKDHAGCRFCFVPITTETHNFTGLRLYGLRFEPQKDILGPELLMRQVRDCGIEKQRRLAALLDNYLEGAEKHRKLRLRPLGAEPTRSPYEFNYLDKGRAAVSFEGRGEELRELLDFVRSDDSRLFRWWAVTGPGGAGKSRLAYELQNRLLADGDWDAAALGYTVFQAEGGRSPLWELPEAYPGKTLLIVDYVQQHAEALALWFRELAARASQRRAPLRLLLLERDIRDENGRFPWWEQIRCADHHVSAAAYQPLPMRLRSLSEEKTGETDPLPTLIRSFADYLCQAAEAAGKPLPALAPGAEAEVRQALNDADPGLLRPLFAMMLTDAWLHDPETKTWTPERLIREIVERELDLTARRLCPGEEPELSLRNACFLIWRTATVLGAGGVRLPTERLETLLPEDWAILSEYAEAHRNRLRGRGRSPQEKLLILAGLWEEGAVSPLRPDLLGEALVLEGLRQMGGNEPRDFFAAILTEPEAAKSFFLRVLRDYGPTVETADGYRDWLIPADMALPEEGKSDLVWLLKELFVGAPQDGAYLGAKSASARGWLAARMAAYTEAMEGESLETASACHNLAYAYNRLGDYPKALGRYQQALSIKEKLLGTKHPDTGAIYNNLAALYQAMGNYPKSLVYQRKALAIAEKLLGKEAHETAATYNNLAVLYRIMGNYRKSLKYQQKALAITEKLLGTEHPDTAASYNSLAALYHDMGNYPKALEYQQKALTIREKLLGTEHPDTATSYNSQALLYRVAGDYPKALEYHKRALAIREKLLGTEHPDTATSCNNIGVLYAHWGRYREALPWLERAFEIYETTLGQEHPDTKVTRESLENVKQKLKDP